MARSFSNAKLFSAFVADGISNAIYKRGYSAASQGAVSRATGGARSAAAMLKKPAEEMTGSSEKVSWVPDPVTGVYRPENLANELDGADLRAMFLKHNNWSSKLASIIINIINSDMETEEGRKKNFKKVKKGFVLMWSAAWALEEFREIGVAAAAPLFSLFWLGGPN